MSAPTMTFTATFDGQEPRTFTTLQSAMAWAEELDSATGSIAFDGTDLVVYDQGDISAAPTTV